MASKIFDRLMNWSFGCGAFMLGAMGLFLAYDVIMRYAFTRPNIWAMQMSEYTLVYATFFGAAWVLRNEGHVRLGLLTDHLSPKAQTVLGVVTSIIGILVCIILLWKSSAELIRLFMEGTVTHYYPWHVKQWPTIVAIPFGSLLLSIQFVRRTYKFLTVLRGKDVP